MNLSTKLNRLTDIEIRPVVVKEGWEEEQRAGTLGLADVNYYL